METEGCLRDLPTGTDSIHGSHLLDVRGGVIFLYIQPSFGVGYLFFRLGEIECSFGIGYDDSGGVFRFRLQRGRLIALARNQEQGQSHEKE